MDEGCEKDGILGRTDGTIEAANKWSASAAKTKNTYCIKQKEKNLGCPTRNIARSIISTN